MPADAIRSMNTTRETGQPDEAVRIVAVGDVSLNGHYHRLLERRGVDYPCRQLRQAWSGADLIMANLESPVTGQPRVAPTKCSLRGSPLTGPFLQNAGISTVCIANNHMMDYGPAGVGETLDHLDEFEIARTGAGTSGPLAGQPAMVSAGRYKIGILAYCEVEQRSPLFAGRNQAGVNPFSVDRCCSDIRNLRNAVDWVMVQLHWGTEMALIPAPHQRSAARQIVDAGADAVLGHHPHVLQPVEWFDQRPVFYSLGNFLFSDMYWSGVKPDQEKFVSRLRLHPLSRKTGWAELVLERGKPPVANFWPALLKRDLSVAPDHSGRRREDSVYQRRRMDSRDYGAEYAREARLAADRTTSLWQCHSLARRIEMKCYQYGIMPRVAEGT